MTSRLSVFAFVLPLGAAFVSCSEPPLPPSPAPAATLKAPFTGYQSAHYKEGNAWLCLPGREDACAANLDATEVLPDGTRKMVHDARSKGADKVDCFYVYPTVDLGIRAANHDDFSDLGPMTRTAIAQAASFRTACRVFAPLYRQVTIGAYLKSPEVRDKYLEVAASDVVDAFLHYMGTWNEGRKVVLVGHSQGAEMVVRLLKRFFDDDPGMRERLLLAIPIGGKLEVASGQTVGGTFSHIPACSHAGETGCIVGYRSYVAGVDVDPSEYVPSAGHESICVDPAELDLGAGRRMTRALFPVTEATRGRLRGVDGVTTPFVMLRDFYRGECARGADGFRYLAVSEAPEPNDKRVGPVDLSSRLLHGRIGLHILDLQFEQGDLVDLVARRAEALP